MQRKTSINVHDSQESIPYTKMKDSAFVQGSNIAKQLKIKIKEEEKRKEREWEKIIHSEEWGKIFHSDEYNPGIMMHAGMYMAPLQEKKTIRECKRNVIKNLVENKQHALQLNSHRCQDFNFTFTEGFAKIFAKGLAQNHSLKFLELDYSKLNKESLSIVAEGIEKNKSLREISLRCNFIEKSDGPSLVKILKSTNLKSLSLESNLLNAELYQQIASALKENNILQHLSLEHTGYSEGIGLFFDALKDNQTLTFLNLTQTYLDDAAATALVEMLAVNTSLKTLNLSFTKLSEENLINVANALKNNHTLETVSFSGNDNLNAVAGEFAELLKDHPSLKNLHFAICNLDNKSGFELIQALKDNPQMTIDLHGNLMDLGTLFKISKFIAFSKLKEVWVNSGVGLKNSTHYIESKWFANLSRFFPHSETINDDNKEVIIETQAVLKI